MAKLTYTVHANSDDPETDRQYLQEVQKVFRGITERLSVFAYSHDGSWCDSAILSDGKVVVDD